MVSQIFIASHGEGLMKLSKFAFTVDIVKGKFCKMMEHLRKISNKEVTQQLILVWVVCFIK